MDREHRDFLISQMPETEYGRAFFSWIDEELAILRGIYLGSSKECGDPLSEDFRTKLGMEIAFERVKRKPQEIIENQKGR